MFVDPISILKNVGLKEDMIVADFGCGSGGWALPISKELTDGKVFAVDVQEEPLSALEGKAKHDGIRNITTIVGDLESKILKIMPSSCDLVLISNVLFQADDKKAVLSEAFRVLKNKGKLLIVEWTPQAPMGPKESRLSQKEVEELAGNSGFSFQKEIPAGLYHFALLFKKL